MRAVSPPSQPDWTTDLAWTEDGKIRLGLDGHELADADASPEPASPRELFCGSVAACLDAAIRDVAARMGLILDRLAVLVTADVDARGAALKNGAPVGVQSMVVAVLLRIAGGATAALTENLVHGAESQSVLLQTLRAALPIRLIIDDESAAAMAA